MVKLSPRVTGKPTWKTRRRFTDTDLSAAIKWISSDIGAAEFIRRTDANGSNVYLVLATALREAYSLGLLRQTKGEPE